MNSLANPYFTHAAFYMGTDQIIEAVGTEKNPDDDIQIATLSTSDWLNEDVKNFAVIRPKKYRSDLENIKAQLRQIADDPDYTFGFKGAKYKKATCADLIFDRLIEEGIITIPIREDIITPDFLFYVLTNIPNDFEVIGYDIGVDDF